jgi:hypothetical protein
MALTDYFFGRRLATFEEGEQRVGVWAGIPMLGLDALGSAAYGPEAALTLLIPLGAAGVRYIGPISTLIIALLLVVYFSYRQTIAAYPHGGGSYTVAKENLGTTAVSPARRTPPMSAVGLHRRCAGHPDQEEAGRPAAVGLIARSAVPGNQDPPARDDRLQPATGRAVAR